MFGSPCLWSHFRSSSPAIRAARDCEKHKAIEANRDWEFAPDSSWTNYPPPLRPRPSTPSRFLQQHRIASESYHLGHVWIHLVFGWFLGLFRRRLFGRLFAGLDACHGGDITPQGGSCGRASGGKKRRWWPRWTSRRRRFLAVLESDQ